MKNESLPIITHNQLSSIVLNKIYFGSVLMFNGQLNNIGIRNTKQSSTPFPQSNIDLKLTEYSGITNAKLDWTVFSLTLIVVAITF